MFEDTQITRCQSKQLMSISQTKETPGLLANLQGAREVLGHLDLLISILQINLKQVKLELENGILIQQSVYEQFWSEVQD